MSSNCLICSSSEIVEKYQDELGSNRPSLDYDFSPYTRRTFRIVECQECTHQFVDPMPNLEESYEDVVDYRYLSSRRQRIRTSRGLVKRIVNEGGSGNLLDIGCNAGFFLDVAQHHFDTQGLELSSWASDVARASHLVHKTKLCELKGSEKFDVITLLGVIEHFQNPYAELREVNRLTTRGGLIVVFTGTRDSFLPRILGKRWWWYQGMHLQYFTHNSLELLLNRCGFEVVKRFTHTSWFSLESLHRSACRYPIARWALFPLLIPYIRSLMIPIRLSGERVFIAQKRI